jgi:hypothetical protein
MHRLARSSLFAAVTFGFALLPALAFPEEELKPEPPEPAVASTENPLEQIASEMRSVGQRLGAGQLDDETRAKQKQIVDALEKLLQSAQSQQQQPNGSNQPMPDSGSQDGSGSDSTGASSTGDGASGGRRRNDQENAAESSARTEGGVPTDEERRSRRKMLTDAVWGHLPPRVREQLNRSISENYLPEYDQLVRRYYEALARQPRPTGPSNPR